MPQAAFDPDAYLDESSAAAPAAFDPDAYLENSSGSKKRYGTGKMYEYDEGGNLVEITGKERYRPNPMESVGEAIIDAATGVPEVVGAGLSQVGAGLGGIAVGGGQAAMNLIPGVRHENAIDAASRFIQENSYSPQTEPGQRIMGNLAAPVEMSGRGWGMIARELGASDAVATEIEEQSKNLINAGLTVGGGMAAPEAAAVRGRPVPRVSEAPSAPIREAAQGGFNRESVGAAATAPDLSRAPPHVKSAVEDMTRAGIPINRETLGRRLEADSLPVPIRLTSGQLTQDPTRLSLEQNLRGKSPELAEHFKQQNQQLIDNLDEIRAANSPTAVGNDHVQNGQALIDSYKAFDEPIRADIREKYKALEQANGGEFPVNGKAFVKAADAALAKKLKGRYVPGPVAGVLDDLREGGKMTFENFENLRTDLAAEARKAERSGDGNAAAAVNVVREALENLPIEGEAAKLKPLADAARAAAKARFDRLREDPAYRAAVDDSVSVGEPSPLADDFIGKHVVRGKAANVKKMRENLGADPTADETIKAGAMNYLKAKSGVNLYTNEGNFSQAGYNRALAEITPKLKDLVGSEAAEQLQTLGNVARYTQFQPRGSFVNTSNAFTAALGHHAATAAEGFVNVAAKGIPVGTYIRKGLAGRAQRKFAEETVAGIKLKDLLKQQRKK